MNMDSFEKAFTIVAVAFIIAATIISVFSVIRVTGEHRYTYSICLQHYTPAQCKDWIRH